MDVRYVGECTEGTRGQAAKGRPDERVLPEGGRSVRSVYQKILL
jgi:hypothetical protein